MQLAGAIMKLGLIGTLCYQLVQLKNQSLSDNGEDIWDAGTFRYKVEVTNADGSVDTIYIAPITLVN